MNQSPMLILEDKEDKKLNQLTLAVYVLQCASLFVGVTALVAIIINYIKRPEVQGTRFESHFAWQIRTFWGALLGYVLGVMLFLVLIGYPILLATWVWFVYRVVRGLLNWNDGKPMPDTWI
jgi:uncharacterized membrane protein